MDIGHHGDCLQWEMNIYFSCLFCLFLCSVYFHSLDAEKIMQVSFCYLHSAVVYPCTEVSCRSPYWISTQHYLAPHPRSSVSVLDPADWWRNPIQHQSRVVRSSWSWAWLVVATDHRCLRATMMMMMLCLCISEATWYCTKLQTIKISRVSRFNDFIDWFSWANKPHPQKLVNFIDRLISPLRCWFNLCWFQMMEERSQSRGKEGRSIQSPRNTNVSFEWCLEIRKLAQLWVVLCSAANCS